MESFEGFQSFVPMSEIQQNFTSLTQILYLKNPLDPPLYLTYLDFCSARKTGIEFKTRALLSDENCSDNDYDDEDVNDDDDDDDDDDNNTNHNHSNNFDILKESSLSHGGYSMCFESCFLPAPKYCTISFY